MSFLNKLFNSDKKNTPQNKIEKKLEYDFNTPGLSQWVTFGRNRDGEVAAVVLNKPDKNIHKIIVNHNGCFENFPGIISGKWINNIVGNFNFDSGKISFRTSFEKNENGGFRCFWEIQPDGRYWADEDGFGIENDVEIILYADLDEDGNFISPFRIFMLDGKEINATDALTQPIDKNEAHAEPKFAHEQNVKLAEIAATHIAKMLETPIDKSEKKCVEFPYSRENKKTCAENFALLSVNKCDKNNASLKLGVHRDNTELVYSNFILEAGDTQDKIKTWLLNTDVCIPIILNYLRELSDKIDNYWD